MHHGTVPEAADSALEITLLRHGELIVIDFAGTGTLIPRGEVRADDAFLSELTAELAAAALRGSGAAASLAKVGGLVFSHLLTEPVRRRLRDSAAADLHLRLDERLVHVPWELCHDGERFLFERFRIGRQVITAQQIAEAPPRPPSRQRWRVLVVADPAEDLPQAALEGERLCALLDELPGLEVTLLAGRSARRVPLLAALQEHDAVHFAGHSHFDAEEPARSGWQLADGVLAAAELARLRPPPLLVFSNSCAAAATAAWSGAGGYEGGAFGLGSAFLIAGVRSYVGTFWAVHDAESRTCATAFYRALAAGARLGDALADARQAVLSSHGDGFTWAGYLYYGDPSLRPLATRGRVAAAVPSAAATTPPPRGEIRYQVSVGGEGAAPAVDRVGESHLVGREADLERLESCFAAVERGERGTVLVSGPPGIGKTALLDAFAGRLEAGDRAWVAHGQAVEHYGAGEAYLPLLEALGRLAAGPAGRALLDHLRRHAPSWLAQLPALTEPAEQEALAARTLGSTRERMLRELADVLEVFTAERALVLVLEDLHWGDHSTIEAVSYLAQRREPARLLVVGTFRPAEVLAGEHPLRAVAQELVARRRAVEMRLDLLAAGDVERYLEMRFAVAAVEPELVGVLHARTEGHPLFLVNVVDFALREGLLVPAAGRLALGGEREVLAATIPDGLLPMIERQIEALAEPDRHLLEAAAVAGAEFAVAGVAAALGATVDEVEERCEALAWRGQMLRAAGVEEWPDGTLSGRYRFTHALYQNVLYQRVAEPRRIRLHRRLAEALAAAHGERAGEIAAQLAAHFEAAREPRRAVEHRVRAGDVAVARHAEREAVEHYRRALELIARAGDGAEDARELEVLVKLATRLMSTAGYAAPEIEELFERAYALARRLPPGPHRAPLLRTLVSFHHVRARFDTGRAVGEELLALCERGEEDRIALVQALYGLGALLYDQVELETAQGLLERALEHYDAETHAVHVATYGGYDPGIACCCWLAWILWSRGEADRALAMAHEGLALAERLGHPFSLSFACMSLGLVLLNRREIAAAAEPLARAAAIATEDGFPYLRGTISGMEGWARLLRGDVAGARALCERALAEQRATGAVISLPAYATVLAYAYLFSGEPARALAVLDEWLAEAERMPQPLYLSGLWRARAEVLAALRGAEGRSEVGECHRRALEIARSLDAPMIELNAAIGAARALRSEGRVDEARALLRPLLARFREGLDTGPLREAHLLLES